MKLPFKAAAAWVASPKGREAIQRAREKYDTPENRERAAAAFRKVRARFGTDAATQKRPRSARPATRPPGLP